MNIVVTTIIISIFVLMVGILLFLFVLFCMDKSLVVEIHDDLKELRIKYKQERDEYNNARHRLNESLKQLCAMLKIEISYHEELGEVAGRLCYWTNKDGRLLLDDLRIEIIESEKENPFLLAHELGHYFAITQRNDKTETGADMEALRLCKTILTDEEQEALKVAFDIFFKEPSNDTSITSKQIS